MATTPVDYGCNRPTTAVRRVDMHNDAPKDFAQLMFMVDGPEDCWRGVLLLVIKGEQKDWRWYDRDLFDDPDHVMRFVATHLREHYDIDSFLLLICTVGRSDMCLTTDFLSN
jgi:hypothetical protein